MSLPKKCMKIRLNFLQLIYYTVELAQQNFLLTENYLCKKGYAINI